MSKAISISPLSQERKKEKEAKKENSLEQNLNGQDEAKENVEVWGKWAKKRGVTTAGITLANGQRVECLVRAKLSSGGSRTSRRGTGVHTIINPNYVVRATGPSTGFVHNELFVYLCT